MCEGPLLVPVPVPVPVQPSTAPSPSVSVAGAWRGCSVVFRLGPCPFQADDGGVIAEPAGVVVQDGAHEAAQGLGYGQAVGVVADEEVGEPVQAELPAACAACVASLGEPTVPRCRGVPPFNALRGGVS